MAERPRRVGLAVAIGLVIALAELALDCRAPASEGCVWGKAYLPLSLGIGLFVVAPLAYGGLTLLAALRRRLMRCGHASAAALRPLPPEPRSCGR